MRERLIAVRHALHMTQAEFASGLNISGNFVYRLEKEGRSPSDRTILDICRVYGVNEVWLRTGVGEMFRSRSREEEITSFLGSLVGGSASDFQLSFISALAKMTPEQWDDLERLMASMADS